MAGSKRSAIVWLSLIGAYIGVSYCVGSYKRNDAVAADLFTSPQECAASGRYDRTQCDNAYAEAARLNQQSAPRYNSLADCEADFSPGACDRVPPASAVSTAPAATLFPPARPGSVPRRPPPPSSRRRWQASSSAPPRRRSPRPRPSQSTVPAPASRIPATAPLGAGAPEAAAEDSLRAPATA